MIENRDSSRKMFLDVWQKHQSQQALEPLEEIIKEIILQHPEYHEILGMDEASIADLEFTPEAGVTNPFLHMGMHIAIQEQIKANWPVGITALYQQMLQKFPSAHDLEHEMMECLGEILWQAQRNNQLPDEALYLEKVRCLK